MHTIRLDVMPERYIIWDFEGTLATRKGRYTGALERAAAAVDPAFTGSADRLRRHLGGAFPWHRSALSHTHAGDPDGWWSVILAAAQQGLIAVGMPRHLAQRVIVASREIYLDLAEWNLEPDAIAVLEVLSARGGRHTILSNFAPELPDIVAGMGLSAHLDHVFCSGCIGLEKPSAALYAHVIQSLLPAQACPSSEHLAQIAA